MSAVKPEQLNQLAAASKALARIVTLANREAEGLGIEKQQDALALNQYLSGRHPVCEAIAVLAKLGIAQAMTMSHNPLVADAERRQQAGQAGHSNPLLADASRRSM